MTSFLSSLPCIGKDSNEITTFAFIFFLPFAFFWITQFYYSIFILPNYFSNILFFPSALASFCLDSLFFLKHSLYLFIFLLVKASENKFLVCDSLKIILSLHLNIVSLHTIYYIGEFPFCILKRSFYLPLPFIFPVRKSVVNLIAALKIKGLFNYFL